MRKGKDDPKMGMSELDRNLDRDFAVAASLGIPPAQAASIMAEATNRFLEPFTLGTRRGQAGDDYSSLPNGLARRRFHHD